MTDVFEKIGLNKLLKKYNATIYPFIISRKNNISKSKPLIAEERREREGEEFEFVDPLSRRGLTWSTMPDTRNTWRIGGIDVGGGGGIDPINQITRPTIDNSWELVEPSSKSQKGNNSYIGIRFIHQGKDIIIYKEENEAKFKVLKIKNNEIVKTSLLPTNNIIIKNLTITKLKGFQESSKLFKYGRIKETMFINNSFDEIYNKSLKEGLDDKQSKDLAYQAKKKSYDIEEILMDYICKEDSIKRDIVTIKSIDTNRCIKFVLSELDFILPDIDLLLKGYNIPKNKKIEIGSKFIVNNNRDNRKIPLKSSGLITAKLDIKIGTKSYYTAKIDNKKYTVHERNIKII